MDRGGSSYYYIADSLGSIVKVLDAVGNVINRYVYNSFGNIVEKTEGVANPYTYTGREYDAESGLYYYRARYYDASIGRFLSEDPILGIFGAPQTFNLYPYALNNPITLIDPLGLYSLHDFLVDTASYSTIVALALYSTPGAQQPALVFAAISVSAVAIDITLYSKNPYTDTAKEITKMVLPVKKPYDLFTDRTIDMVADSLKEKSKKTEECVPAH